MAESTVNIQSSGSTPVATVNDGTGNRQIVVLGAGDGTTNLNDGSVANPLNVNDQLTDIYVALKSLINVLVSPPWIDKSTGALKSSLVGSNSPTQYNPFIALSQIWNNASGTNSSTGSVGAGYNPTDSMLHPLNRDSWANNVRTNIN